MMNVLRLLLSLLACASLAAQQEDNKTLRVFVFAGQSNMVGSDSSAKDIPTFPPFAHLNEPQKKVRFWYCLGRENKKRSDGWTELQPVDNVFGPELAFADRVRQSIKAPIAIIKVAAGGTDLGKDWNPDEPDGFKMYPLALAEVKAALQALDKRRVKWRLEGFVWHQGENDSFNEGFRKAYGKNLTNIIKCWRRDLDAPKLRFYVGELCTKTIWGMDLRRTMYDIRVGQREATDNDPLAQYVPTSHVGVKIGNDVGLHYHYGSLGQLEHGVNHAEAYLKNIDKLERTSRKLAKWPYGKRSKVDLYVLAGHRNMEGERGFVADLQSTRAGRKLQKDLPNVAFRYDVGGGAKQSEGYEPLGPAGLYETFGPELSFAHAMLKAGNKNFAVAKFTHSGSQLIDWSPDGSYAKERNLYPAFLQFVRDSIAELEKKGHRVNLRICYHVGENDMSYGPYRRQAPEHLAKTIAQLRKDLRMRKLEWIVTQQPPTKKDGLDKIDVVAAMAKMLDEDSHATHVKVFDLPKQKQRLVLDTDGIIALGERIAAAANR